VRLSAFSFGNLYKCSSLTWLLLIAIIHVQAQTAWIKGKVLDAKKQPLSGASVRLDQQELSVLTDREGEYNIKLPNNITLKDVILSVSYIGKKGQEVKILLDAPIKIQNFTLHDVSLALDEVAVQASAGKLSNSSMVFDREMIERYPALSLNDLLNRLPNRKNSAPSVQEMQNLSLRGAFQGTTAGVRNVNELNNAFGVAIIMDDMALSNNGNMQGRNPGIFGMGNATNHIRPSDYGLTGSKPNISYSGENVFGGIDLRQIPIENIERVEVISGVAPARYGDISNGAVIIERQAGVTPTFFRVQVRSNATSYGLSKGTSLGKKLGMLNMDLGYVKSYADNRDKLKQYDRITGSMIWTNFYGQENRLKQTFSGTYNKVIDRVNVDPDDPTEAAISFGSWSWNAASRTSYRVDGTFIKNINFNAGVSSSIQATNRANYYNDAVVLYTDSLKTGIVEGQYASGQYIAYDQVDNRPLNLNGRLEANAAAITGNILHRINFGANYSYDINRGVGRIADPSMPKKDLGARSERYYDFSLIHALQNIGVYAEDAMQSKLFGRDIAMRAGMRLDIMNGHASFSPRTNINYMLSETVNLGLAYGLAFKSPGIAQLYPGPVFNETILLNAYNGKESESLALIYLRRYEKDSKNLKSSFGQTLESSISWNKNGHNLRTNFFYKRNSRVISTVNEYTVINLPTYTATTVPGQKPIAVESGTRNYLFSNLYFNNDITVSNFGTELMYSTPRILPIMTTFSATAGFTMSNSSSKSPSEMKLNDGNTAMDDVVLGLFPSRLTKSYLSRAQLRSSTHIPALRLIIELSADCELLNYSKVSYDDLIPVGYYTRDYNYHPVTNFNLEDKAHKELFDGRKKEADLANQDKNFVYWNFNLNMAKEIGKNIYLSFNVYNFLDYQPRFYKVGATSVIAPNSSPNYGAQLTYKF
jgi:ferric enterobactin receptor